MHVEELGRRVQAAREQRGYSVRGLARDAGLSDTMLHRIERGESMPGLEVAARLAQALAVRPSWLLFGETERGRGDIIVAPNFLPTEVSKRISEAIDTTGQVPEEAKYLDPDGCRAYLSLVSEPSYRTLLEGAPLRQIADQLRESVGQTVRLGVVCLGSGHGAFEDRLLALLLPRVRVASVSCVDISSALLVLGGRRICETLQLYPQVDSSFVYGDFHDLPWEVALQPDRRNLITLFGNIFCNYDNAEDLVRRIPLKKGDIVLLDITLPASPPDSDPALSRPLGFSSRLFDFLAAPLLKGRSAADLQLGIKVEIGEKDYCHRLVANTIQGRQYTVGIARRISVERLEEMLAPLVVVGVFNYGASLRAMVIMERM